MKSKVVIENHEVDIILTPENDFEKDLIEKITDGKQKGIWSIFSNADYDYQFGTSSKHKITINLKETH